MPALLPEGLVDELFQNDILFNTIQLDSIEEAEKWYWSNYRELPEGYPQLGLR
jgi:hypothetical protein